MHSNHTTGHSMWEMLCCKDSVRFFASKWEYVSGISTEQWHAINNFVTQLTPLTTWQLQDMPCWARRKSTAMKVHCSNCADKMCECLPVCIYHRLYFWIMYVVIHIITGVSTGTWKAEFLYRYNHHNIWSVNLLSSILFSTTCLNTQSQRQIQSGQKVTIPQHNLPYGSVHASISLWYPAKPEIGVWKHCLTITCAYRCSKRQLKTWKSYFLTFTNALLAVDISQHCDTSRALVNSFLNTASCSMVLFTDESVICQSTHGRSAVFWVKNRLHVTAEL